MTKNVDFLLTDIEYRVFYRPKHNPLETFYLPTLAASARYDRSAGYFRSSALAAAAAGIVRLIQNDGYMRLLVGAELSEKDVEAIEEGYEKRDEVLAKRMLEQFPNPGDGQLKQRLDALTWMVAHDTLDIKVVLPLDEYGFPIPGAVAYDYYHTKKGIFTDVEGNRVGFSGSINESAQASDLGAQTSPVRPWPHQRRVSRTVVGRFPDRVLLCDEVGLGNPWDECDLLLASSHLAKRKERVPELLAARPWDLLLVDEAHHARRRDFLQPRYRPNSLLTLLNQLKAHNQYRAIILATATPMQVHPVEVWDLLTVLGLGGRWGADEENFLRFFNELRRPYTEVKWDFVYGLVTDHLGPQPQLDTSFCQTLQKNLGPALATALSDLPKPAPQQASTLHSLPAKARPYVAEMARRHTPISRYMFRSTRNLLRQYVKAGLLQARVPRREPHICRIPFRPDEAELYERITEYISHFYQRYEAERRGLGFIMTVYRRRLTSSFQAIRRSLERRRDWLQGVLEPDQVLTPEDEAELDELDELEQAGLDMFTATQPDRQQLTQAQRSNFQMELDYLEDFIGDLRQLSQADSKLTYLKDELERIFHRRSTALVFTQYTDTMDYLRDQLETVYGSGVACYSGRGGETWNGLAWVQTPKEMVKDRFREGEIKILLCTESASEGLNLQTCGVLINYDMPWNPMRVEQRIGRIDRIGQEFEKVWIYNYFYKDSIEDRIYQALSDRIDWFEDVVGDLQPILSQVGEVTRKLAMLPAEEQAIELEEEVRRLRAEIESARLQALNLTEYLDQDQPTLNVQTSVTLTDLETILTRSDVTRHLFQSHPDIPGAYQLRWKDDTIAVTFSRESFDKYPDTLQFLSYGNPILAELLASIPEPEAYPEGLARLTHTDTLPVRAWYNPSTAKPTPLSTLADLRRSLGTKIRAQAKANEAAQQNFEQQVQVIIEGYQARVAEHSSQYQTTLQARARRLLLKGALVEICLGQHEQRSLFSEEYYPRNFDEIAVVGLKRHKSPWSWLLLINGKPLPQPSSADPFLERICNDKSQKLKERFKDLAEEARAIVKEWKTLNPIQNLPKRGDNYG